MKLIVFDCDGTLIDGQHLILDAMQSACRMCEVQYPGDEAVRHIVGLSLSEAIALCHPDEAVQTHLDLKEAFIARFQEMRADSQDHEPLYDGIKEVIIELDQAGYLLGIATGKSRRGLMKSLANNGLSDYFLTLNTADDGPGKPHPSMLHNAMRDVGAVPENTFMVGDTTFDMKMAHAAEVRAIGVSWGYHDTDSLEQAGAHHMINHISELRQIVER